jgi:alpha-glucosidase
MRWDSSPNAGFSAAAETWLPVGPHVEGVNVADQRDDPDSMLSLYRRLLALRRAEPALSVGSWQDLGRTQSALAFLRTHGRSRYLVVANFTDLGAPMPDAARDLRGEVVLSTLSADMEPFDGTRELQPNEALIVRLA